MDTMAEAFKGQFKVIDPCPPLYYNIKLIRQIIGFTFFMYVKL